MKRESLLEQLRETIGFNYIGDSTGYGVSGVLYRISEDGVTWLGTQTGFEIVKCPILSNEECEEVKRHIKQRETKGLDLELVNMVKADCKPDVQYWRLGNDWIGRNDPEYFSSYDEALDVIGDLVDGEFTPWEEMDEGELEKWIRVVRKVSHE